MGGKALTVESVRLPASRYHKVTKEFIAQLNAALPGKRIEVVEAYATKPDFGDMDVLIEGGDGYDPYSIGNQLQATEIVRNGDVTSIGIAIEEGIFQVDLIKIPAVSFDFALRYFSYNDMGNLLGRVAHKFGAKFGHLGLQYMLRDPNNNDHLIGELTITHDFSIALELIGYNSGVYESNRREVAFNTLDDIFRFVVSSPFVNKDIFLLDNRNHAARTRDSKRPTYNSFLHWLEQQPVEHVPTFLWGAPGSLERTVQRQEFLHRSFAHSPSFKALYEGAISAHERQLLIRRHFNGQKVSALTGLSGRELGQHMRLVRESFTATEEFEQFFASASESIAEARIMSVTNSRHVG